MLFGRRDRPTRRQRRIALDALSVAYTDGQLDKDDHEALMARVMAAQEVDDLRATLTDLQLPSRHPVQRLLEPGARTRRTFDWVLVVAGAIFLLLIGAALTHALLDDGPEPWPEPVAMMEKPAVDRAFSEIREELGTTEVIAARISESKVAVHLPADGAVGRYQGWYWDGHELRDSLDGAMDVARPKVVDLEDVDTTRLFANVDKAVGMLKGHGEVTIRVAINGGSWPSMLNVDDYPDTSRTPAHVEIAVGTEINTDNALLITDPSGRRVLRRDASNYDPTSAE